MPNHYPICRPAQKAKNISTLPLKDSKKYRAVSEPPNVFIVKKPYLGSCSRICVLLTQAHNFAMPLKPEHS